jgi:hypothetical protein
VGRYSRDDGQLNSHLLIHYITDRRANAAQPGIVDRLIVKAAAVATR